MQDAIRVGLGLVDDLVRLNFKDGLSLLYLATVLDQPTDE
jgi:hypothetical protein